MMSATPISKSLERWFPRPEKVLEEEKPVILENRTGRRIAIAQQSGPGEYVLGPFETLKLHPRDLESLNLGEWKRRNLISVSPPAHEKEPLPPRERLLLRGFAVLAMLMLAVGLRQEDGSGRTLILAAGGALLMAALASQLRALVLAAVSSLTLLLVGLVGFGLPAVPLALWMERTELAGNALRQTLFLHVLWWLFIGLASVLPASLYFLFTRIKMRTLRESFLRDVVRMNPSIDTVDDADVLYGPRVDELYGQQGSPLGTHLPILFSTLLLTLGWLAVAPPPGLDGVAGDLGPLTRVTVVSTGFLGAYFFILQMLFRRYVRADLGPKAYTHVSLRLLSTAVLVWMLGLLPVSGAEAGGATGMLVLAFFTGIVPDTAFVVLQDFLRSISLFKGRIHALTEQCPLTDLEGITLYDRARFLEEGVENVENLAHHSLIDLMLWTRLPTSRLLDLVDQSILYLHVVNPHVDKGRKGDAAPSEALAQLRRYGLRTATDLIRAHELASKEDKKRKEVPGAVGQLLGLLDDKDAQGRPQRLKVILGALEDDDWVLWLRHWHQRTQRGQVVHHLEDFSRGKHRAPAPEPRKAALGLEAQAAPASRKAA